MSITPFKVHIPDEELQLLKQKLEHARLPLNAANASWAEDNGVTVQFIREVIDHWRTQYDWRREEAAINQLPQFQTPIDVDGFGTLNIHFVHATSSKPNAIPLLFVHGWPGSFIEVGKILPKLTEAGYHVVAPSLPGYGFSSYPEKKGFTHVQHSEVLDKIMQKLGYSVYVAQGGDWGSWIVQTLAVTHPDQVRAIHLNMLQLNDPEPEKKREYTDSEKKFLERMYWFFDKESSYSKVHVDKPLTLGFGLHDSPVAMLAWMADKLFLWTDAYPWTKDEIITWTLLHYFPGPATGLVMYRENPPQALLSTGPAARNYVKSPTGVSAFPKELCVVPRSWAQPRLNIVSWAEHDHGGHFAAYEKPTELFEDMDRHFKHVWEA